MNENLEEFIGSYFNGSSAEFCQELDNIIFLLHYLDPDFKREEKLNACATLKAFRDFLIVNQPSRGGQ